MQLSNSGHRWSSYSPLLENEENGQRNSSCPENKTYGPNKAWPRVRHSLTSVPILKLIFPPGWLDLKSFVKRWAYFEHGSRTMMSRVSNPPCSVYVHSIQRLVCVKWLVFCFMKKTCLLRGKSYWWLSSDYNAQDIGLIRSVVLSYFAIYEADLVRQRKANRLKRKRFWSAGANDIWAIDQHDKWKYKFGLALHTAVEPFVGRVQWLKIWWTNSNPRLILSYYLETVKKHGCRSLFRFTDHSLKSKLPVMPLVSQSDPGAENFGVANGHTLLRHWHDPSLRLTLQHRWMREKKNIPPEIFWSQYRRRFAPGFEDLLDLGVNKGWYSPDNYLEAYVKIPLEQTTHLYSHSTVWSSVGFLSHGSSVSLMHSAIG